jgi:hypothetical protein
MKIRNTIVITFFLGFGLVSNAFSQEFQVGIDLDIGVPQNEFSDQLDRVGAGIGLTAGYRFPNSPVMLGLDFGFMNFGKDVREAPFSTTIPDVTVEVENRYNLVQGNAMLRLIAPSGVIRPFADGLIGFNYFFTETVIQERRSSSDEVVRDTNFDDVALSYGFGAGLQFRIYQDRGENSDNNGELSPGSVYLNLMSRYMFGREAEYLQSGSIEIENGEVFYDVSESTTDLLYFKLGLIINF